jgi:predicted dienelactone hydrolase
MIRRVLLPLALLAVISCGSSQDPSDLPKLNTSERGRYGEEAGTSSVGSIPDVRLHDEARNRDLLITIDYPIQSTGGAQPLILLSHAAGGSNRGYVGLAAYWASFGYVVVRPAHGAQASATDRVRDLTFVLDSIDGLERDYPELKGKIDHTRAGVAGHGDGALAAMLLGGAKTFPGGASMADARVKAIVAMSPAGPGAMGLTNESFATIATPALFMTGSRDEGASDTETPEWRRQAFTLAPAGDKWFVLLEGASTSSFAGRLSAPAEQRQRQDEIDPFTGRRVAEPMTARGQATFGRERTIFHLVRSLSLGFWDAYLRGEAGGREYLQRADQREDADVVSK